MGAPSGSANVFAIGRVRTRWAGWDGLRRAGWDGLWVGFGSSVGNRPAALPPGLRTGLAAGMLGRLPTGSGAVTASETGSAAATLGEAAGLDAATDTLADALGTLAR